MKVISCYKKFPSDSADVVIYVHDFDSGYNGIVVEFFPSDPLERAFYRGLFKTYEEAVTKVQNYIDETGFERVNYAGFVRLHDGKCD